MRNIYATVLVFLTLGFYTNTSFAQQEAQYTQYMYNTSSINPAYAGSRDVLSMLLLYRTQWTGLDGAPRTFSGSAHAPLGKRVGIGVNVTNDEIFISKESYFDIDFSYTIDVSEKGQLAFGIKAGGQLLDIDSNRANSGGFNTGDPVAEIFIDNRFSPRIGAGVYYYTDKFYFGFSVPNFLETEYFDESNNSNNSSATAKENAHYYFITGYTFDLSENILFKPALLTKMTSGAPLQVDLSANFLIYDRITLGAAYRWSAAVSGMVGFQITDQLMLGFAYDSETTDIRRYNGGSYEFMLRFELFNRQDRLLSPRFF
ncbi:MAG: type IX secretion system membrane protein PorP/SprF [Flavobacteriaceae bacterium]|nr:type IX secretion system membrane protein PorP/SprF [Flavobacteriaceae bacterium]